MLHTGSEGSNPPESTKRLWWNGLHARLKSVSQFGIQVRLLLGALSQDAEIGRQTILKKWRPKNRKGPNPFLDTTHVSM